MTFDLMKRRISLLFAAPVALITVTVPAVTHAQQRTEFTITSLGEQDAPDRALFCSKQHVQRRIGLPIPSRFQQGYPVYAALLIVNGRNASGMQSYAAEFYSHLPWDILQIASQMRKYLPQQGSFHISDYFVIQCDPIEFPNMPLFDELVEQRRSGFGFLSSPAPRPKMVYYPLKPCNDDQICEQIQQDFVTRPPALQAQVPQVHAAVRDPKSKPPSAEPHRTAFVPERNYPNPDYPLIPPAAEIRPGQSIVAYENATCSSQGNWLLTYQGTVVSTSQEEVQVFVNKRTGLYNYVGEPGPAGEKEKVWDKGYLCAPRREICFGDVDFEAWNGQITKGSPVPFPRDSVGVVDDVTKDPVPIFKHFLTRACGASPMTAVTAGSDNAAGTEKPAPGAETTAAPEAPAAKPPAAAPAPAVRPPGKRGL
jgi:hypothetical protein